jgi:predicted nucleic acid-binding protein
MTVYADTSTLMKRYVREAATEDVLALLNRASIVAVSTVAYAELRAGLARLRREKRLTSAEHSAMKRRLDEDWPALLRIDVTDEISREAGDLAERFGLRGFDSLHLASFVSLLSRSDDDEIEFSSFDDRLNKAAKSLA